MHIREALTVALAERLGREAAEVPPPASEADSPPRYTPILPFLPVLRGRPSAADMDIPGYHPSVSYAGAIYTAVAINAIVDAIGLANLVRGYLSTLDPLAAWATGGVIGSLLSWGFASFAVTLVKKPIRTPSATEIGAAWSRPAFAVLGGAGVCLLAATVWSEAAVSGVFALAVRLSWATLLGGLLYLLVSAYGGGVGVFLMSRLVAMMTVGFIVATPLHELMFQKEIAETYRDVELAKVDVAIGEARAREVGDLGSKKQMCLGRWKDGCDKVAAELRCTELLTTVLGNLASLERNGGAATMDLAAVRRSGCDDAVVAATAGPSGAAGRGEAYRNATQRQAAAIARLQVVNAEEDACRAAVTRCDAATAQADDEVRELEARRARLLEQHETPGSIDRAAMLEALIRRKEAEGITNARSVVQAMLLVAWLLSMLLPALVFIMKVTGGSELEPYLRRRWVGR